MDEMTRKRLELEIKLREVQLQLAELVKMLGNGLPQNGQIMSPIDRLEPVK